jgi:putative MFS transporter
MPESPRFLVEHGRHAEAEAMLHRIEAAYKRALPRIAEGAGAMTATGKAGIRDLWSRSLRRRTCTIWAVNFAMTFSYYGIFIWLPTLLATSGYQMAQISQLLFLMGLSQVPGKFLSAYMVERAGRRPTIVLFCALYAVTAFFLGQASEPGAVMLWGCLLSFVNSVVFSSVLAFTAESYPTYARSTGAGLASAFGRLGGVFGPLFIGSLLGPLQGDYGPIFIGFAAAMLIGAFAVAWLGEETRGRTLEEIARA